MPQLEFVCAMPSDEHARLAMQWRNHPETLKMSFHRLPKVWSEFQKEFIKEYFNCPDLPPLFISFKGQLVAMLRFRHVADPISFNRRCCELSIVVAPAFRGKGIGTTVLIEIQPWIKARGYDDIYAEIKPENSKSIQAFLKAGFSRLDDGLKFLEESGNSIPIHRYILKLTPENIQKPVFIIAEAGSNWRIGNPQDDIKTAKKMIDTAADAGANAVKFQTFRPESIYVPNAGKSGYLASAGIEEDMHALFEDLAMPYEMIPKLVEHCCSRGIEWMSTPFSPQDFEIVRPYIKRNKIASYEIGHLHLVRLAAQSGLPTYISTGAATEDEIAWAVKFYYSLGGLDLTLLQCTACYPARPESLHLKTMTWLQRRFDVKVGLSDHSQDPIYAPVAAVALGASVIEKHFTLDRSMAGPDHAYAIIPNELKAMVKAIRETEKMIGSSVKFIDPSEQELRQFARRGIQAIKDIGIGEQFKEDVNIAILRPGNQLLGIHPKYIQEIEGKTAAHPIKMGMGISIGDWN